MMGSRSPPQPWPPYPALKDCSQGYCSYYCPQWCYFLFPTPPPPTPPSSHAALSPLLIAVISILSTAFLLTAYYLILSKFRRHFHSPPTTSTASAPAAPSHGLDDTLISKLASCQYRPGAPGALVPDGADCSVCLGPFQERDLLRLLPRCGHAFHARCIDVWLRARSTCPLCRSTILPVPPPPCVNPQAAQAVADVEAPAVVEEEHVDAIESVGELGGAGRLVGGAAGRSLSMDSPFRRQANAADVSDVGSSSSSRWTRALHCVVSPVRMKRSSSSSSSGYTRRGISTMLPI